MASPYAWKSVKRGDDLPEGAVQSGQTKSDGPVYIARNKQGECGKLNLDGGKVWNLWCHDGGSSQECEVFVAMNSAPTEWRHVRKGDKLPVGALLVGNTRSDGAIYAARNQDGACGKLNLSDGKVNNLWCQGENAHQECDVLIIHAGDHAPLDESGYECVVSQRSDEEMKIFVRRILSCMSKTVTDEAGFSAFASTHSGASSCESYHKLTEELSSASWASQPGSSPLPAPPAPSDQHPGAQAPEGCVWNPEALCGGVVAKNRAQWLIDNKKISQEAAREQVMQEFSDQFKDVWNPAIMCDGSSAEDRAKWLMDNKGMSLPQARAEVRREFPAQFGGGHGGHFVESDLPHTLSVVQSPDGPKLKIAVIPKNPQEVTLVAVHYEVNGSEPGKTSMNFDINQAQSGTNTYVHVTPNGGGYPLCPPGSKVEYWLGAVVNGVIQEEPHGACSEPPHNKRLSWTAM